MADEERFRRLARSSPWRWRSLRFTHATVPRNPPLVPVRAWVRRPDALRVETIGGALLEATPGRPAPTNVAFVTMGAADPWQTPAPTVPLWWTDPTAPRPPFDADGLVRASVQLPLAVQVDDPMWQDYRWVAMLNPRELADAESGGAAVAVDMLETVRWHDRPALRAVVRPLAGYTPRCGCCPLLPCRAAALAEGFPDPDGAFADAHELVLDLATSVCVHARELGGPHDGRGFDVVIEAVDEDLDDALFLEQRPPAGRLRRLLDRVGPARPGLAPPEP